MMIRKASCWMSNEDRWEYKDHILVIKDTAPEKTKKSYEKLSGTVEIREMISESYYLAITATM